MDSNFINDEKIRRLIFNINSFQDNSLDDLIDEFEYNQISFLKNNFCNKVVGIDGSVNVITDRISYYNKDLKKYQTYIIDPIIFIRTISVYSNYPFIKTTKIRVNEELKQIKIEEYDRESNINHVESEQLQLMEISHIIESIDEMEYGNILLLDMALYRKQYSNEINQIINKASSKGINVVGWAKDSDISTKKGLSYTNVAKIIADIKNIDPPWYSKHPHFPNNNVFLYMPPWGDFCFRIDIANSSLSIDEIFNELINCSKNSLGYPLVLYKAHQRVKITMNDANIIFRKIKKIAATEGIFIDKSSIKPFHEHYLDI